MAFGKRESHLYNPQTQEKEVLVESLRVSEEVLRSAANRNLWCVRGQFSNGREGVLERQ